jgi:hypothetical protein
MQRRKDAPQKEGQEQDMKPSSPSYKRLSWQIGIIAGILPGIYAGFWLGQNTIPTFLAVVLGPFLPFLRLTSIPQAPAYSIPLAFVFYIVCGYLLTQLTGMIRWGVTSATAAGIATTVVTIITTILIWSHLPNLFSLVTQAAIAFVVFFFITIPAAALGGLLGSFLGKAWRAPWPKPLAS